MLPGQRFDRIDGNIIDVLKSRYSTVVPSKLHALDEKRYDTIPEAVKGRGKHAFLTKEELVTLVEWKVSHGKFRPTLKGLALQNAEEFVESVTTAAFAMTNDSAALKELTKLRGIGPATAALLLAVHKPDEVPFFSDELFRWCFYEDKTGQGWDRKIKYTPKEYSDLFTRVTELRQRLAVSSTTISAVDIEKAAYVLGKEAETGAVVSVEHEDGQTKLDQPKPKRKQSTDRTDQPAKTAKVKSGQNTRRSTRNENQSS